jgi:hypothetical protein
MNKIRPIRELLEFKLDQQFKGVLPSLPTVCLIAADAFSPALDIGAIVDIFVPSGCTFFMTWGEAADELHDAMEGARQNGHYESGIFTETWRSKCLAPRNVNSRMNTAQKRSS